MPDLRSIRTFPQLVSYREAELDWPLREYGYDDLTFEYQPADLGLKDEDSVKVKAIHQLRPLQAPVGVTPILKCWMELN